MTNYYKVIEFPKTRISPKNIDWQRIDRTVQETKESIHTYCERLLKAFKEYSGKEAIEPKDMLHFVFPFVEGLRPEVGLMIKSHLICWQAKPIDEVLQYAKYCSDEIELKQKKLKEKAMVMQIKAAQTGVQGALVQPKPQQQRTIMFQPQMRGGGCGMDMTRGPDLGTVVVQNDMQGMKKMLLCHLCGNVGHWKQECPLMVQDGVVQQGGDVSTFQTVKVPKRRGFILNVQNRVQSFQPLQQVQVLCALLTQLQPIQQQVPMVPRQQMQIPQAPMEQQQMMLTQQVTGQRQDRSNDTVHQFPIYSEDEINEEWMSDSSDEGPYMLAASLEVDQRTFCERKGDGFQGLIFSGHRSYTLYSKKWGCSKFSSFRQDCSGCGSGERTVDKSNHRSSASPVSLLRRDLLCKTKCSISCSNTGIEVQTNSDDEEEQVAETIVSNANEEYPLIEFFPMFTVKELHADLQGTVQENVWDLTGKVVGLIKWSGTN
ncbi:hypothetical protein NDU88_005658 [Pleurodeles waltl]|uniref:CCHC-type domain-containing protein n=1 Tax=Pleurodeles waltl TaxID=8319 RepID=A0AAV7UIN3_PLEWA|nr:hypothetical protein NDU88_005658 [Pleurodeles waltl]